ncbi:hypothetical protein E2C01_097983 [Portunus trituberculatus]|uniref:Uncharacterized protein n=1 Tax=Portunus trituberculatus TaxID=210409 RepID=A0A5B7K725_PORTR|nr:hypothetical protein [Portunus trituberculatus]
MRRALVRQLHGKSYGAVEQRLLAHAPYLPPPSSSSYSSSSSSSSSSSTDDITAPPSSSSCPSIALPAPLARQALTQDGALKSSSPVL